MFEEVKDYYENYDEDGRLFRDKVHMPEYLTTIRLIISKVWTGKDT